MSDVTTQISRSQFALQCPMPKIDFDFITLGHGSGGVLTNRLLDKGVFDLLSNDKLDTRHDGALLNISGQIAFTTDSFVINPVFFPGGDIGELAVNGTVNDLAMCGAIPKYISLGFILEEGLPMQEFWDILVSIKYACMKAGVHVVTGDTKVVERGKGDKIFVNTTGIGVVHNQADISTTRVEAGDCIIVSNNIATHGVAIMSVREGLEFETTVNSDTTNLNHTVNSLLDNFGSSIKLLRDATRGGVATVLTEIARSCNLGIDISERSLPVDEQVAGACEMLGLDPLYVANEGVFVAVVSQDVSDDVVALLKSHGNSAHAASIGNVTEEHSRQVVLTSSIGGRRVVNMLVGEQLPRIC